jgi:hypothetical protein
MSTVPAAAAAASSSDPGALLASLSLQSHPVLTRQLESAQRLLADRRYGQAEEQVKGWMKDMQKEIKDAAAAAAASSSSGASASLPTLSQMMTAFLPFLRTVGQLRKENESAEYDVQGMVDEVNKYKAAMAAHTAKGDASAPKPVRAPHADYVHPHLKLADLLGRGCGVVAAVPGLPEGCAAPASSASSADDDVSASHSARKPVIAKNTTILVSKALGFVTAPALPLGVDTPEAEQNAHEEKMANALVTLLALKLGQEASLIPVYTLDAGERYAEDRARRLASQRSPLEFGRPSTTVEVRHEEGEAAESKTDDLEIDLARLALIVSRNAFAPPQLPEREEERVENGSDALQQQGQALQSSGLWLTCSLLNHACRPNASWFCVGDVMFVRSLRDIFADEEITISYTGFDAKTYDARRKRCEGWGFECSCREWCEPFTAHGQLAAIENEFVTAVSALDPNIHSLVDQVQGEEEGTAKWRNVCAQLRSAQSELQKLIDQFKTRLMVQCEKAGGACIGKGPSPLSDNSASSSTSEAMIDVEREIEEEREEKKSKSKAKKKTSAAASSSNTFSSATSASRASLSSLPQHTRCLLIHLAAPLSLLALCAVSLPPQSGEPSLKTYKAALSQHERYLLTSIHLLSEQYGSGDETVVFAWLEMLNTWMQFASGGVEYRRPEEMKAIFELVVQQHCEHFGAKPAHFKATWEPLMQQMGLEDFITV